MDKTAKHIEIVNYEAQQFLKAFRRFRDTTKDIDQSLCANLLQIVAEIDEFIDSKPNEVTVSQQYLLTAGEIDRLGIQRAFVCKKCEVEFGQSLDNVRAHVKTSRHLKPKIPQRPATVARKAKLENPVLPKKVKSLLLCDLQKFLTTDLATAKKLTVLPDYKEIEKDLLDLIRPSFPNKEVKTYLFGSRISGVGNIYSDLDIFLDIGNVFNNFENRASSETVRKLEIVERLLAKSPKWNHMRAIPNARVPILKVMHKPTSINCDLGFSNSVGFCNTKLVRHLLDIQPLAKAMCLFVKKWLERSKLNEHITTYSGVLLVIFFLQQSKLLPSIQSLQESLKDPVEIGPWMAAFAEKNLVELNIPEASDTVESFKLILKNFFEFYSTFDFKKALVAPYLGLQTSLENLENLDETPLMPRYTNYIKSENLAKDATFQKNFMNVQDPFQLNHNVTKAVPATVVLLLQQYFDLTAKILADITTTTTPQIDVDKKVESK